MPDFRSGYVAVIGRPNVGKSTLINALVGQKIAAVSPRPQTTRRRQLGILTTGSAQLIFVDTPGLHHPRHKLGRFLNQEAQASMEGVDVVLWVTDLSEGPTDEDVDIAGLLANIRSAPTLVLAANKTDLLQPAAALEQTARFRDLLARPCVSVQVSATHGTGMQQLTEALTEACPVRAAEYEESQVTDVYERDIAADLIREAALFELRDEVPHAVAVRIDEFTERPNGMEYIAATLFVERDSQKGIVIGEGGKMLKRIGMRARREIEAMGEHKVFLDLHVKVEPDWRNDEAALKRFGYDLHR